MSGEIVNMNEWEATKAKGFFSGIAEEIRAGYLQLHFPDNLFCLLKPTRFFILPLKERD